jgi:MoaA/NifB/PqqE/SkfB family radical SAM enzyme
MSVRNCLFPWHSLLITNDGQVLPCGHGSRKIGDLNFSTIEEIWNGPIVQELRASILEGRVHHVCESTECPYQREDQVFPESEPLRELDAEFCSAFDETHYLEIHSDVAAAVHLGSISSGLEHYYRHGNAEGRSYRLGNSAGGERGSISIIYNLQERAAGMTIVQSLPTDVVLAVTTVCNLKCVMCPHGMGLVPEPRHMPIEYGGKLKAVLSNALRIILSGVGEPTLAPAFWHVIDTVGFPKRAYTRVNSNAHFITPENATRLVRSNLSEISISLDAATGPTYRKIRGGSFKKALRGILNLVRAKSLRGRNDLKIYVNMTLMTENICEAEKLIRMAYRMKVDGVVFTQLFQFGNTPSWRVNRGNWTFVYSQQLISDGPNDVRLMLSEVMRLSEALPMSVYLRDNVASYLNN